MNWNGRCGHYRSAAWQGLHTEQPHPPPSFARKSTMTEKLSREQPMPTTKMATHTTA